MGATVRRYAYLILIAAGVFMQNVNGASAATASPSGGQTQTVVGVDWGLFPFASNESIGAGAKQDAYRQAHERCGEEQYPYRVKSIGPICQTFFLPPPPVTICAYIWTFECRPLH